MSKQPQSVLPYRLLDAGEEQKLEMVGPYKVVRQAAQAFWPKLGPAAEWRQNIDGIHIRTNKGGGYWDYKNKPANEWTISWQDYLFKAKFTDFGHIGLFPEQGHTNLGWITEQSANPELEVINLFGYTGGSSLAAARGGARVTHLDAAKGVVTWARENFELNKLGEHPTRWIVDDATKFLEREVRRGRRYHGFILDPPTYGRGAKNQVWRIEQDLIPLLELIKQLADPLHFILLSCHTPGYTEWCLRNILHTVFDLPLKDIEGGEMTVPMEASSCLLPSGTYARWSRGS